VYASVSVVATRRASESGLLQASCSKPFGLRFTFLKTMNRREQNVNSVIGGIDTMRATTALAPVSDNTTETMSMVKDQ
jgi:hypothetical protein